jgi:hypothetical protein
MMLAAVAIGGYAWWLTGSLELAWSWLLGRRLVFLPAELDCGTVSANEIVEQRIRVVNLASRPVTLTGVQQSCACITLEEFPVEIAGGNERHMELKVRAASTAGSFEQFMKIFADDSGTSVHVVRLFGTVR